MNNLPSVQNKAIEKAIEEFRTTWKLSIYEPCNCGSRIQHNNGGNYHDIVHFVKDSGRFFRKDDTTCELTPNAEWEETTEEEILSSIKSFSDWL